jgi:hypothetical protein
MRVEEDALSRKMLLVEHVLSSIEERALGEPSSTVRARGAGPARSSPEQKPPKSLLLVIGVMT